MDPLHPAGQRARRYPRAGRRPRAAATWPWSTGSGSGVVQNHALAPFAATPVPPRPGRGAAAAGRAHPVAGRSADRAAALARPERWALVEATARNDPGEPSPMLGAGPLAPPARRNARGAARHGGASLGRGRAGAAGHHAVVRRRPASCRTPYALRAYVVAGRGRLPHPARRPGPPRRRAHRRDAAQRLRQQGPLDHRTHAGARAGQHPAHDDARGASAPDRPRPAQPDRRQSVLARPLRRARRRRSCACCAACCRGSSRTAGPTATRRCCSGCCACSCARAPADAEDAEEPGWDGVEELVGILMHAAALLRPARQPRPAAPHRHPGPRPDQPRRVADAERAAHRPALAPAASAAGSPGRCSSCSTTASGR